jgi:hypothetical protein
MCKEERPLDREHFNYRSIKDGKFGNVCKPCQKQYRAGHYQRNKAYYIEKAIKSNDKLRMRNRKLLWKYLSTHPCVDCGMANPLVLEFDHVRGKKAGNISRMITRNGWTTIMREIDKCEVRCANCHRIKTATQRSYYKNL